jgi:hypothetical protein
MLAARLRHRRRGVTMVDVALGAALLTVVSFIAIQFVLSLSQSAEGSLLRANSRRQVALVRTALTNDFGTVQPCGTNRFGPTLQLSDGVMSMYTLADDDDELDLVAWRLEGSSLQRGVVLGSQVPGSDCSSLDVADAQWSSVAQPVRALDGGDVFVPAWRGGAVDAQGLCLERACRADQVEVRLALDAPRAGQVDMTQVFSLPQAAVRTPSGVDPVTEAPTTVPAAALGAPRDLAAAAGNAQVTVSWQPPLVGTAVGYTVAWST